MPFLSADWIQLTATVMEDAGGIIFGNLPLIFAVGVAIGLAKDGAAALAALVGYLVLNQVMSSWLGITPDMLADNPVMHLFSVFQHYKLAFSAGLLLV